MDSNAASESALNGIDAVRLGNERTGYVMGPLRIGANGRSFSDQEGKPFFWLGDTLWEQFRLYSLEDARTILEKRKAQGFTVIQIMLTGLGDGSQPNLFGEPPWL